MVNLPLGLFSQCINCLTVWLKCDDFESSNAKFIRDSRNLLAIVRGLMRVQFLPYSEPSFLESLESASKLPLCYASKSPAPLYPGIYGHILINVSVISEFLI